MASSHAEFASLFIIQATKLKLNEGRKNKEFIVTRTVKVT